MRNFFIYARSRDNQFFSCSIVVNCQNGVEPDELAQRISDAAQKEFLRLGNPLPPVHELVRFRAVVDPRNDLNEAGYPCAIPTIPGSGPTRYKRAKA